MFNALYVINDGTYLLHFCFHVLQDHLIVAIVSVH